MLLFDTKSFVVYVPPITLFFFCLSLRRRGLIICVFHVVSIPLFVLLCTLVILPVFHQCRCIILLPRPHPQH
jgi:hypothetical protein